MEDPSGKLPLIGREKELGQLRKFIDDSISGKGSTTLISGEAGVGKTRLMEEFQNYCLENHVQILTGSAISDSIHPFLMFSKALENDMANPLFMEQEHKSFAAVFAINRSGLLVAKAASEPESLDADIFAGMFSAVQNFLRDSLDSSGEQLSGLGRLEYGNMKIIIEHGPNIFLTAVFQGTEHPDMINLLKKTVKSIEKEHGEILKSWTGNMSEVASVQEHLSSLANAKFLVRRDLEGVKLENERIRIADEVLEILKTISAQKPLLLLLEDLHWADESSLFVLNYLARNINDENILIAGTMRPEMGEPLQDAVNNMSQESNFHIMPLIQLGLDSVYSLVESMYPDHSLPEQFLHNLADSCQGNPFFLIELLRQMKDEGNISFSDGKFTLVNKDYSIPGSVEDVVQRRLDNLDPEAIALAEYASCMGRIFDCKAAMSARTIRDPAGALERLQGTGIVILNNGSGEFCHAIFHDVIYSGIGDRWKLTHHQGLGEFFETEYSSSQDQVIYELAKHFSRSNVYEKGYDYCFRAGEKAENVFALEQALSFYDDSLKSLNKTRTVDSAKKLELLERMGDINTISGNYDVSLNLFGNALDFADSNEQRARIIRKTASVNVEKGEFNRALEILADAKKLVEEGSIEYGRILMEQGNPYLRKGEYDRAMPLLLDAIHILENSGMNQKDTGNALRSVGNIHWYKGEYDKCLQYYERSLKIMESIQDKYGIASTMNNIGNVHHAIGNFDLALDYFGQCLEIMEKIGGKQGIAASMNNLGLVYYEIGEQTRALEHYERSLEIKQKIGDKQGTALSLNNMGNVYYFTGKLDKALEYYGAGLDIMREIGDKWGIALSLNSVGNVHHSMGNLDESLELHIKSHEIRESIGDRHGIARSLVGLGNLRLSRDELDKSLECHEHSLELYTEIGDKLESIYPYCGLAEAYLAMNKLELALDNAESAVELSSEINAMQEDGMARRILGTVLRETGRLEESEREFESAHETLTSLGSLRELGRLHYEHGLLYRAMNEPEKAHELLARSLSMFESMGMRQWSENARKALET